MDRILLIPGLCEPRVTLWPLARRLRKRCGQVVVWRDRYMFRNLQHSVQRLSDELSRVPTDESLAIVTHSFGDWVARQAIARGACHVDAMVSVAPVMRGGCVPKLIHSLTGNVISEIAVIADPTRAAENINCNATLRRLVIWAKADYSLRRVDLADVPNVQVRRVMATHLSVVLQTNVHHIIEQFLDSTNTVNCAVATGGF